MRSEEEMLSLIIDTARDDARVRAVIMNGSRVDPDARRDPFQDFDIVYLVDDVAPFRDDDGWIERFGEAMIVQRPEMMEDPPPLGDGSAVYLIRFVDGNRLDLRLLPSHRAAEACADSLSLLLLDKDGIVPPLDPPSRRDYLPTPPTAQAFADCCSEFWWLCPSVAKGLWRQEIVYAKHLLDRHLHDALMKMATWHAGAQTGFARSPGKYGKDLHQLLEPHLWERLLATYSDADDAHTWEALICARDLFRELALAVAAQFGFAYPHQDDARVSAHIEHVRELPPDAEEIT